MNRLQKKCVIGTVGIHLLLLLILIVGPAFYNQQPKTDDTTVLDMIPANLVDAAVNSGVQGAQPPPTPRPVTPQPPQPQRLFAPPPPTPTPAPAPVSTPAPAPEPVRTPSPSLLEEFKDYFKSKPEPTVKPDLTPTEKQPTTQTHTDNIKVDLHKVNRTEVKNTSQPDNARNQQAINRALNSLSHSLSSATTVDMPGHSSAAYASYASVVKSVYEQALRSHAPESVAQKDEKTRVRIVIANDGTVLSSTVISQSGDPSWDDAVQQTLDQVTFVAAFPDGATEKERSYTLGFTPEVEQSIQ
ncbi:MAG TPA: TonB C-terminal domain-containing protein [Candidatus Acidoferrum sp.]|jgi:TonB family protein|nr:TonB C-terminal domain-containing protein [Candidatus Acidoferrum sp.]